MTQAETKTFNLPDLGEGLTEATLLSWFVSEGDSIEVDQPIAEVETAKSAIEVPSPYAGVVQALHGQAGEVLEVGRPLITVGSGAAPRNGVKPAETGALSYREEEMAGTVIPETSGSGNVLIGYGTSEDTGTRRRRRRQRQNSDSTEHSNGRTVNSTDTLAPRVSSPLVRRLARDHGIALHQLTGSGPGGLILRADVLQAAGSAEQQTGGTSSAAGASAAGESANVVSAAGPRDASGLRVLKREPVTGIRRAIAEKLTQSRREIPEATVWQDVDMTRLVTLREELKASGGSAPSVLALLSRFVLAGLQRYPELAVRLEETGSGQEIVHFEGVNLGFAAQTDKGLMVPVIRRADLLSARGLHEEISRLATAAREGSLSGKELTGGTFTVNNYGVFGSDGATPIINYPEVAILGIGRTIDRPWVVDGELTVRKIATVTIAFDHRVCDGGSAGGFLNYVASCLENPASALLDL